MLELFLTPIGILHMISARALFLVQAPWFTEAAAGRGTCLPPPRKGIRSHCTPPHRLIAWCLPTGAPSTAGGRLVDGSINYMRDPGDCSLLMHSIYGLNHYPNYLLRWVLQSIRPDQTIRTHHFLLFPSLPFSSKRSPAFLHDTTASNVFNRAIIHRRPLAHSLLFSPSTYPDAVFAQMGLGIDTGNTRAHSPFLTSASCVSPPSQTRT